ncbi:pre-mRNA-splicing factor SLT11 [Lentinula raphanica]|nr:pre-mRNA-splicing factor SLT11 [Lentinula raphanica]
MPKIRYNKVRWEQSEFPVLCLGDNPFIRMSKQEFGRSYGTCAPPFTAKTKNVSQTCLLDLIYGLPTQVRDTALGFYHAQNMEEGWLDTSKAQSAGNEMLNQLARTDPYYKHNRRKIARFSLKGNALVVRPSVHIDTKNLSTTNFPTRTYKTGIMVAIDLVARKILGAHAESQGLKLPEDQNITSLFLSSLSPDSTELSIRTQVLRSFPTVQPAELKVVVHVAKSR